MRYLEYLTATWEEFRDEIKEESSLILIPVGCVEEHGPHLPLNTDCIIGETICESVAQQTQIILGPPIRYGVSRTTQGFPGTLEIRVDTLRALTKDILYSFASQGVKILILFTWHGGTSHSMILREASIEVIERVRQEHHLPATLNESQLDELPQIYLFSGVRMFDGQIKNQILALLDTEPSHAAELETSLMLYLQPDLVREDKLEHLKEFPKIPEGRIFMRGSPWLKKGLMGDASHSTKEKGKKIFEIFIKELAQRIHKIRSS